MRDRAAWWREPGFEPLLSSALAHVNASRDHKLSATDTCRLLFLALNRLWNGLAEHQGQPSLADTPAFVALVQTIAEEDRAALLRSRDVTALATLTPAILDHHVLNVRGHHPGEPPSDAVRKEASERQGKFERAHARWLTDGAESDRVFKKLAELLYVVRSNIQHGEKTPYGPDLEKGRRDELVSSLAIPVQRELIELLLDWPDDKLVAYGTLRPGEVNASVLGGLEDSWTPCTIRGAVRTAQGFPSFRWDLGAGRVEAMLLRSAALRGRWAELDRFEGPHYARRLVTATTADGLVVANCYEGSAELRTGDCR